MSNFDVENNRIPFFMLTKEEQGQLMNGKNGWQAFISGKWQSHYFPVWADSVIYRCLPAEKVKTVYLALYKDGHAGLPRNTIQEAINSARGVLSVIIRTEINEKTNQVTHNFEKTQNDY